MSENTINTSSWRSKFFDFYQWCKIVSISLNVIYMVRTFENIYDAGSRIDEKDYANSLQYGFQILIGCLMVFCLIGDLVVINTSKLFIANWYWRPGILFFTFTFGNEVISITDRILNEDIIFQNCQQRLMSAARGSSIALVSDVCGLENQLGHLYSTGTMIRNIILCGAYTAASYFYIIQLIQVLKRNAAESTDTALHVMSNNYHYPITQ